MFFTHSFLYDIAIVTLLLTGFIVFIIYTKNNFKAGLTQKITSIILLFLNIRLILIHLYLTKGILDYPHLLIVANLVSRLAVPLIFLLVFYTLVRPYWKWYDIFHFIPALCFLILHENIYLSSADEKRQMLLEMYEKGYDIIWTKGIWFNQEFMFLIRSAPMLVYVILIISMLSWSNNFRQISKKLRLFLLAILYYTIVNLTPLFFNSLNLTPDEYLFYVNTINFLSSFLLLLYFFFIPDFLYARYFNKAASESQNELVSSNLILEKDLDQETTVLYEKINKYLLDNKAFLDPEFNIEKLESGLDISDRKISTSIKRATGLSFAQYINDLRIAYLMEIADEKYLKEKTFNQISYEIGFNSVNSFYAYFKQKNECTPQVYFKRKFNVL